jgi:hypothetical protein
MVTASTLALCGLMASGPGEAAAGSSVAPAPVGDPAAVMISSSSTTAALKAAPAPFRPAESAPGSPAGRTGVVRGAADGALLGSVTLVDNLPGAGQALFEVRQGGSLIGTSELVFGQPTVPVLLGAGTYSVSATDPQSLAVVNANFNVVAGLDSSVAVFPEGSGGPSSDTVSQYPDDTRDIPDGQVRVSVRHNADAPAVDVYVDGHEVVDDLSSGSASSDQSGPAGPLTITVTPHGSLAPLTTVSTNLPPDAFIPTYIVTGPGGLGTVQLSFLPVALGYQFAAGDGGVFDFGAYPFEGSLGGQPLNAPITAAAGSGDGGGYYEVGRDGGVFTFGDARFFGSLGGTRLNAPIVGLAVTPDGGGYWLVGSDGGVFSFGDAHYFGSLGGAALNAPIVAVSSSPDGAGYRLIGADGGVFDFGDASFMGSLGGTPLAKPIIGAATTPDGRGLWLVAADGGVFSFGEDAAFYGSTGAMAINRPVVGMVPTADGLGYALVAADGGVFTFGDESFFGSTGAIHLTSPIVAAFA